MELLLHSFHDAGIQKKSHSNLAQLVSKILRKHSPELQICMSASCKE
jgi:hypothetical protein